MNEHGNAAFLFAVQTKDHKMDEYQDGTPSGNEAPDDDDVSLSPSIGGDTQDDDSAGSEPEGDTASQSSLNIAALQKELQELKDRVSGGTRSWQEERAARQRIEQELAQERARLDSWRKAGVRVEEVDAEVRRVLGEQSPAGYGADGQRQQQGVTLQQVEQMQWTRDVINNWNAEKRLFMRDNPEFNTSDIHEDLDLRAIRLADREIKEYGRVVSTPDKIFDKAIGAIKKIQADAEKRAMQKASETRQKVKSQGVTEGAQPRRKPSAGETTEPIPTNADYANFWREQQRNTRRGIGNRQ